MRRWFAQVERRSWGPLYLCALVVFTVLTQVGTSVSRPVVAEVQAEIEAQQDCVATETAGCVDRAAREVGCAVLVEPPASCVLCRPTETRREIWYLECPTPMGSFRRAFYLLALLPALWLVSPERSTRIAAAVLGVLGLGLFLLLNASDGPTTFVQLWSERVAIGEGAVEPSAPTPPITGIEPVTRVADLVLKVTLPALWLALGVGAIMQMGERRVLVLACPECGQLNVSGWPSCRDCGAALPAPMGKQTRPDRRWWQLD